MANVQKEHGFTPIANEFLEALARIRIPGEARQVLDVILRKTWGFNKKTDRIAGSQLVEATGLDRRRIHRARRRLLEMNLIVVTPHLRQIGDAQTLTYAIQKDYTKWRPSPKRRRCVKLVTPVTQNDAGVSPKMTHTKDTLKDTIQKTDGARPKKPADPRVKTFIDYHFQNHQKNGKGPYVVKGKKDGELTRKLLGALDLETLKGYDDDLFTTDDEFVREAGYTIGVLYAVIGKLQAARAKPSAATRVSDPRHDWLMRKAKEETELVERLREESATGKD